jgi:hypothetical protein
MLSSRVLAAMLLMSTVAGCAVMESRFDSDSEGIVYYLPRTLVKTTVTSDKTGVSFKFEPVNITDLGNRYALNYRNNPFFHDRLCVLLDENNGYLKSIEYASQDATPSIAVALAQLGARLSGQRPPPPSTMMVTSFRMAKEPPPPETLTFSITFDPLDPERVRRVNNEINRRLGTVDASYGLEFPDFRSVRSQHKACDGKGVCFRTKVHTAVRVVRRSNGNVEELDTVPVDVYGPVGNVDLSRAFLVEKVVRLSFKDGALEELIMKKPSEALQAAKLPLDVLDVLLAVPGNFVDGISGTKAARQAYVDELDARTKAIQSINASLDAMASRTAITPVGEGENIYKLTCQGRLTGGGGGSGGAPG